MICIYDNLNKKVLNLLKKLNVNINEDIKIYKSKNFKLGHYQIHGLYPILNKYNININFFNKYFSNKMSNIKYIDKIDIININKINIYIKKNILELKINKILNSKRLGVILNNKNKKKTIIIDYSSPNLAKEMHIGNFRSTVIGDSMSRIIEFLGFNTIRINHVGDWGINFGIIITKIIQLINENKINLEYINLKNLEKIYIESKKEYYKNIKFHTLCKNGLCKLQNGDSEYKKVWSKIVNLTLDNNNKLYKLLNIKLNNKNVIGESFYQNLIPDMIKDLISKGIAIKKDNLILIPINEFKNKDGNIMNIIVQRSDGTYLYSTTEIASIKYRCEVMKANKIIYYIDNRQNDHLLYSFNIANKAKYSDNVKLEYHSFGIILSKNNKPLKTREGNTIKLIDLINKSINEAKKFMLNKNNNNIDRNQINKISCIIGINALKYYDLSKNRMLNYNFDINEIISIKNNTYVYIQYSYVRILSILRLHGIKNISNINNIKYNYINLCNDEEINLSFCLIEFNEILNIVARDGTPNILCSYLYKVSKLFSKFYEIHNILNDNNTKSRLNLCILTAKIIKKGLNLLGIKIVKKM